MKYILLFLIKIYQKILSYDHGLLGRIFPNTRYCRYTPSCSQYTYEAVSKFGAMKGISLGIKRLSTCHQWSDRPHFDPVPEK